MCGKMLAKASALLAACLLCLSVCSCGGGPSTGDQMYEKYKDVIDSLEREDYEQAIGLISEMMPEPEERVVEITADNFWDYYEVREGADDIERDADGNVTDIIVCGDMTTSLALKEEYGHVDYSRSGVEVGVTVDHHLKRIEDVDWSTGMYALSEEDYDQYAQELERYGDWVHFTTSTTEQGSDTIPLGISSSVGDIWHKENDGWNTPGNTLARGDTGDAELYVLVNGEIEIVRAEGQLVLVG